MTHGAMSMTGIENPSKGLSEFITRIEDARNVAQNKLFSVMPFLQSVEHQWGKNAV